MNRNSVAAPLPRFIVKVQLPVVTSDPQPKCLVYDQSRRIEREFPATRALRKTMGGSLKRYFYAHLMDGELPLEGRAPEQTW